MPKLEVTKESPLSPQASFEKVTKLLENDRDLKKLDASYTCQFDAATLSGSAKGKLFNAKLEIKPNGGGSSVAIHVELPFALSLAKGLVQKTLQKKLDESLA